MSRVSLLGGIAIAFAIAFAAPPAGAQEEPDRLLETIKKRGVMRACAVGYVPWIVRNPINDQWEGINAEIADEIAKPLNVKIEYIEVNWATILQSLQTGKCDIAVTATWTAPQRAELISFTRPIGGDGMTMFVPADSTLNSYEAIDQKGKLVVVRAGSGEEKLGKEMFKNAEVKSLTGNQAGQAILEVAAGRADGAFAGHIGNQLFVNQNPNVKVKALPDLVVNYTPFAFAVPGRQYFFRDYVNVVIGNLEASGRLQQIRDKHMQAAATKK
jgi:polar amino acid transport system substrate-binding protein